MKFDTDRAAGHLAGAIRFKTISHQDRTRIDRKAFLGLHGFLKKTYPNVHRVMKRETVNGLSLLYTWPGRDIGTGAVLLMSHLDVVPVEHATEAAWEHPPFSGTIDGGYVWGRGALDVKNGVIGIMEAAESLAASGFRPSRTVYIAYGHDEEVLGNDGAAEISRILGRRDARLACVLDEGGFIRDSVMPGVTKPAALVGIAEKGYLSLELSVRGTGGHSSTPPRRTAAGRIAAALCRLERSPFKPRLTPPVESMFTTMADEAAFPFSLVYPSLRLLWPVISCRIAASPQSDAMIRTTIAPTMLEGSEKENMMPRVVRAVVNLRILQGETRESVTARVRKVIGDPGIAVEARENSSEPSPVSGTDSPEYAALRDTIRTVFPGIAVAPFLMAGATDARHFTAMSRQVFRFSPARIGKDDMDRVHGVNERMSIENFSEIINFYGEFIRRSAG